jgi:hypothetical protein
MRIVGNKYASHINFNKTVSNSYIVKNTYCIKNNQKNISEYKTDHVIGDEIKKLIRDEIKKQNLEEETIGDVASAYILGCAAGCIVGCVVVIVANVSGF